MKTPQKEFSVYSNLCHSHSVLESISNKWCILLITLLSAETYRFGELKRELNGISPKILTQTLQKLEKFGFVLRQAYPTLPLKVEYSLTDLGKELSRMLGPLTSWTEDNMRRIMAAEQEYRNNAGAA